MSLGLVLPRASWAQGPAGLGPQTNEELVAEESSAGFPITLPDVGALGAWLEGECSLQSQASERAQACASVELILWDGMNREIARTRTDSNGRFKFKVATQRFVQLGVLTPGLRLVMTQTSDLPPVKKVPRTGVYLYLGRP